MEARMDRSPKTALKESKPNFDNIVLDDEEMQIERDLEAGLYEEVGDLEKVRAELKIAAKNTFRKKPVTLRMTNLMIGQLKRKAQEEGLPYQTLMNSVLHKYLSGKFVERD
jgi:predicted DNA binding CopG/RHH family protein